MPYFRATDVGTEAFLGIVEAADQLAAEAVVRRNWYNPGDVCSAHVVLVDSPADLFLDALPVTTRLVGLARDSYMLWIEATLGDFELPGVGERTDAVFIHDFSTVPVGEGIGSALIRLIVQQADLHAVAIYLNPWAGARGALDQVQLELWYERHGWVWWQDHVMVREPRKS